MIRSIEAKIVNHSHIIHADIRKMVAAARESGLTEYSITEHVSQFKELRQSVRFGSIRTSGRVFASLKEYQTEFEKVDH